MTTDGSSKDAIIIGAGPAGLTAAWELLTRTQTRPVVLEADAVVGGIARTLVHHGNRIDIGGHRFFSKSDRVMAWWLDHLPLAAADGTDTGGGAEPDARMLVRHRVSRILYRGQYFTYPITLKWETVAKMGVIETALVGLSYLRSALLPIKPEITLEDFFINRFGRRLYQTFFSAYTAKVWGVPCSALPADWGAQRVKGLSIKGVFLHALRSVRPHPRGLAQRTVETSLIERFLYPRRGPGQLWETVAARVVERGGTVEFNQRVIGLRHQDGRITAALVRDEASGTMREMAGSLFVSTMPVRDLVLALDPPAPEAVQRVAQALQYRDFITVGVLLDRVMIRGRTADGRNLAEILPDNWIYVQEPFVKVGRIQVFNNWSPHLVADAGRVWLGLEYFANEGDALWSRSDAALAELARQELEQLGMARIADCQDTVVVRMTKAYPSYLGDGYANFETIRRYLDGFSNLWLLGRNGMHRYNNQDHSMLSAMIMVDNLVAGRDDHANVWAVNTESDYHES